MLLPDGADDVDQGSDKASNRRIEMEVSIRSRPASRLICPGLIYIAS